MVALEGPPLVISQIISKTLKEKIESEARDLNYLPKVGKLPV